MQINFKLITAIVITVVIIAAILLYPVWVTQRRRFWQQRSLPAAWHSILVKTLPMYSSLSPEQQQQLQGNLQVLLAEKQFIGCSGLQVTLEMKVTIAAIAGLLLFSHSSNYFPKLRSILIYPDAYWVQETVGKGYLMVTGIQHHAFHLRFEQLKQIRQSRRTDQLRLPYRILKRQPACPHPMPTEMKHLRCKIK
jgi:hypothetical protein